jgi:hypothetical protein
MPRTECAVTTQHVVDGRGHFVPIIGMLVGQHQFSGRYHRAGLVAVHALHLLRPFPTLVLEVEAEPSETLRGARESLFSFA